MNLKTNMYFLDEMHVYFKEYEMLFEPRGFYLIKYIVTNTLVFNNSALDKTSMAHISVPIIFIVRL